MSVSDPFIRVRDQRVPRSIAGHRALVKIHSATRFRKGTKNAIVHHLLSPTRPKIFAIGMALSTRITLRMIQCQRLNDPYRPSRETLNPNKFLTPVSPGCLSNVSEPVL